VGRVGLRSAGRGGWGAFDGLGVPGVQPFADFLRGVGAAVTLGAGDHDTGRGHAEQGGQADRLPAG
jgi:hypothetical protein